MSSVPASRWRSVHPEALVGREWNGEFVVRNERSGSTHLLGPLAGRVMQVLVRADAALSVDEIASRITNLSVLAADTESTAAIDAVLSEFRRLGLAEHEGE